MSLSDPRVIATLNRYFVPVYLSNADYRPGGAAPAEEQQELKRIFQEGYAKKLSVGSVHAYVLGPDGHLLDSRHVAQAFKTDAMLGMLEGAVQKLGTRPGEPLVKPEPQSDAQAGPGELLLHLTARYLRKNGDDYALVEDAGGNWDAIPGEDWIRLAPEQWKKLLPPAGATTGTSWELDPAVAAALLRYFYPPTENNDVKRDTLEAASLRATVDTVEKGKAQVRLAGSYTLKHDFYYKDDGKRARGTVVGVAEVDTSGTPRVRRFELVTDSATYGADGTAGQPFGVAVRTVAAP